MNYNHSLSEIKLYLSYNPKTGKFTRLKHWSTKRLGKSQLGEISPSNKNGGHVINVCGARYYASRLAWLFMTGNWPEDGQHVLFNNGNKLDTRWENLTLSGKRTIMTA